MRTRLIRLVTLSVLVLSTIACNLVSSATPTPEKPSGVPTEVATLPPIAPSTINPTATTPTATTTPTTATPTATASITATPTLTATLEIPTATTPPRSTGPLIFSVSIVKCQIDPARDGGVILTIRIDAQGGNGVYTYYREDQQVSRTFERPATKGTAVIDAYRVTSSDGQTAEGKIRFTGSQFGCP